MANKDLTKKRQERIGRRQFLTDRFLTHFVFGIIFSVYVIGMEMATVASYPRFAEAVRVWTFGGGLAVSLVIAILPTFFKKMKTGYWWRTSVYFFAFLGALHAIISLWVALDLGGKWNGLDWAHAFIWGGVLISFIVYMVQYKRVGKD